MMKQPNHNETLRTIYDKLCAQGTMSAAYASGNAQLMLEASIRFDDALDRLAMNGYPGSMEEAYLNRLPNAQLGV